MTPKERFLAAMRREPVDRVPMFDFLFQRPLFTEVIGRTPASYNARDAMDLTAALGLDGVWIPYGCFCGWTPPRLSDRVYQDEWGTTFEQSGASWPIDAPTDYPIQSAADLARYRPPDPAADGRLGEIETAVDMNRRLGANGVAILGGVTGPLTLAWMLSGYENICLWLYDAPERLKAMAQMAADFAQVAVRRMSGAGVDGFIISEDLGASAGGLLAPAQFRAIFKPALGQIIAAIKPLRLPVLLHSCGCIHDYLDDLVELGIDALHPLQRTAGMDLGRVKERYGSRICLVGNIDSSRTLPHGTPADVERETREALAIGMPGNGYILASDHSLHDGIPLRNIMAMLEAGRRFGRYDA